MKKELNNVDETIEFVNHYIQLWNIEDEDLKQNLYLVGLEKIKQKGKLSCDYFYQLLYRIVNTQECELFSEDSIDAGTDIKCSYDNVFDNIMYSIIVKDMLLNETNILNESELFVLQKVFMEDDASFEDITKELGCGRMRVWQYLDKAIRKLRHVYPLRVTSKDLF